MCSIAAISLSLSIISPSHKVRWACCWNSSMLMVRYRFRVVMWLFTLFTPLESSLVADGVMAPSMFSILVS